MNLSHHQAALNMIASLTASLQRVPTNATSDTERTVIQANLQCTPPIEMKNDEKERAGLATVSAIAMMWTAVPDNGKTIKERDRIVIGTNDYRVRKVKAWPMINPAFYELHVEDES